LACVDLNTLNIRFRKNPELTYLTNAIGDGPRPLLENGGICGFGNSVLDKPFCKVRHGCPQFQSVIEQFENQPLSSDVRDKLEERLIQFLSSSDKLAGFPELLMLKRVFPF